jgi:hypothetical protein
MNAFPKLLRHLDAARGMRPGQLAHRPRRLVPPAVLAAGPTSAQGWQPLATGAGVDPAPQGGSAEAPHEHGIFRAVGRHRAFGTPAFWIDPGDGLLFLFDLHGFAGLAAYAAREPSDAGDRFWGEVLEDWLARCGRPASPAWHPFPTSGRVVAWCAALSRGGWPDRLADAMRASLARQLVGLRRSVEYDIGGNHVLRNAAALAIGGACLVDARAGERGLRVLREELPRQILADGGHEERSPSYHRAVLADLRDVRAVLGASAPHEVDDAIAAMERWLASMAGPDGRLPLLNDGWEGPPVEGSREELADLAASGYVVLRSGADQAVLDLAPVSPGHLPAHAHADVGTFVLWADGRPVVVDPGTYTYDEPERTAFRGTAAHATLQVDGRDQFDAWGPFRAAGLPRVTRLDAMPGVFAVEHDGYRPARHRRTFAWVPGGGLVVLDRILSTARHHTASRIPIAPGGLAPLVATPLGAGGAVQTEPGCYAPYFGRTEPIEVLIRRGELAPGEVSGWALLRPEYVAELEGDRLVVSRGGVRVLEARAA